MFHNVFTPVLPLFVTLLVDAISDCRRQYCALLQGRYRLLYDIDLIYIMHIAVNPFYMSPNSFSPQVELNPGSLPSIGVIRQLSQLLLLRLLPLPHHLLPHLAVYLSLPHRTSSREHIQRRSRVNHGSKMSFWYF